MDNVKTIFLGSAGVAGQEVVQVATELQVAPITESVGLVSQIIILVATLVSLFRKKKNV